MKVPDLLPAPVRCTWLPGSFPLDGRTGVYATADAHYAVGLLRETISPVSGFQLAAAPRESAAVKIEVRPGFEGGAEAYRLHVRPDGAEVVAGGALGACHAVQTLLQLLPDQVFGGRALRADRWQVPCVLVADVPRFAWRGGMLDVARHFMPPSFVRKFIDLLAMHKFNVLHLHLTDDQGWRIEVPRYPLLTEIGAWRAGTMVGHKDRQTDAMPVHDGIAHGGYYTAAEITEIVGYAASRGVTVVPEIDMPGHVQAAIAAYPWLGNTGQALAVATGWGISAHVLNVSDRTVDFCREVLDHVLTLFPGRYIHIGGDECPVTEWLASPAARVRARQAGLDERGLTSWFVGQLASHLIARGRRPMGWDEVIEGGLPDGLTLMSWRDENGGVAAARLGHDVVMTPCAHTYFDYYQGPDREAEPLAIDGPLELPAVYRYQPVPAELEARHQHRVLGSQFQIWTEYIRDPAEVEYMSFPRACALAEVLWTGAGDQAGFDRRLDSHLRRLRARAVAFRSQSPARVQES